MQICAAIIADAEFPGVQADSAPISLREKLARSGVSDRTPPKYEGWHRTPTTTATMMKEETIKSSARLSHMETFAF